jgi:hypothetical protein
MIATEHEELRALIAATEAKRSETERRRAYEAAIERANALLAQYHQTDELQP